MVILIFLVVCVGLTWNPGHSFTVSKIRSIGRPSTEDSSFFPTSHHAGFGAAVGGKNKKSKKKKDTAKGKSTRPPFDVSASLLRMEKVYDELSQNEAKRINREDDTLDPNEMVTAEYIVAARCMPTIADWVPVAQVILARPLREAEASEGSAADPLLKATISQYCREISHVAGMGSRVFQTLPRNNFDYAAESVESFHKHVYEVVMEGKNEDESNEHTMTKAEARQVLNIGDASERMELSDIKRIYRKMAMQWHPDRFVGQDDDIKETAAETYRRIKLAYETLQSGLIGESWYESLGGRSRTSFSLVPGLLSIKEAEAFLNSRDAKAAVCGLDPDLVQTFVARSQSSRGENGSLRAEGTASSDSSSSRDIRVLGVCGGIGSGKSTLCEVLVSEFDCLGHIEADKLAHEVYKANSPVLQELANAFGSHLIAEDGNLNRAELGKVVFDNLEALQQLEQIVWPHVERLVRKQIQQLKDAHDPDSNKRPIIVVEAAVLLDAGWYNFQDGVWVVRASPEVALSRLQEFRNMPREEALQRIEAQKSRRGMENLQDELDAGVVSSVVENSGDVEALKQVVHEKLLDDTAWFPSTGK